MEILKSFSQYGQDEFLDTFLFKNFKDGFYVDIGAYDGITFSNTHRFNIFHNWNGINIEPLPAVFKKLKQNRNSDINLNIAVTDKKGTQNFIESNEDIFNAYLLYLAQQGKLHCEVNKLSVKLRIHLLDILHSFINSEEYISHFLNDPSVNVVRHAKSLLK